MDMTHPGDDGHGAGSPPARGRDKYDPPSPEERKKRGFEFDSDYMTDVVDRLGTLYDKLARAKTALEGTRGLQVWRFTGKVKTLGGPAGTGFALDQEDIYPKMLAAGKGLASKFEKLADKTAGDLSEVSSRYVEQDNEVYRKWRKAGNTLKGLDDGYDPPPSVTRFG